MHAEYVTRLMQFGRRNNSFVFDLLTVPWTGT